MKKNDKGFMLMETLVVTIFIACVLLFLYIQFSSLNRNYNQSYLYNTVDGLYALEDIREYITSDTLAYESITSNVDPNHDIDITDCAIFSNSTYCLKMFELQNIEQILVTTNDIDVDKLLTNVSEDLKTFISKINKEGEESYRIVASFNNNMYATIRF